MENKQTTLQLNAEGKQATYGDLLKLIVNTPISNMNTDELRKRFKILDAVESATEEIDLTGVDIDFLKQLVKGFNGWIAIDRQIIEFEDAILAL